MEISANNSSRCIPLPSPCSHRTLQRGLLIAAVAAGVVSVIPAVSLIGTLTLRSVALLFACSSFLDRSAKNPTQVMAFRVIKIALGILSIAAIAAAMPMIIVAALSVDIALQSFDCFKALYYEKNIKKAFFHLGIITIDVLALASLASGTWPCMIAASAVSALAMIIMATYIAKKAKTLPEVLDFLCYGSLSVIGIAGAITTAEITHKFAINPHITTHHDARVDHYDVAGQTAAAMEEDADRKNA